MQRSLVDKYTSKYHQLLSWAIPGQYRILIVDDVVYNIIGLKQLFSPLKNLIIDEVYNGEMAVKKIQSDANDPELSKNQYKFVFMDCNMPIMDGM